MYTDVFGFRLTLERAFTSAPLANGNLEPVVICGAVQCRALALWGKQGVAYSDTHTQTHVVIVFP
jgi:hypothetical protein